MSSYKKFEVSDTEVFDAGKLAPVQEDIRQIKINTSDLPFALRAEIIISFTKNHSIANEWKTANPVLVNRLLSGALPYKNIESLFESSSNNKKYRQGFEEYMTAELGEISPQ